jgi:hypothetical protein
MIRTPSESIRAAVRGIRTAAAHIRGAVQMIRTAVEHLRAAAPGDPYYCFSGAAPCVCDSVGLSCPTSSFCFSSRLFCADPGDN